MTGKGVSHGAVTVVNAMPTGMGATIGIELKTLAVFEPGGDSRKVIITNDPQEDTKMAVYCVEEAFKVMKKTEPEGWTLTVDSEIPVSRGLKSSSSACNAIISSVFNQYVYKTDEISMIKLGVKCAKKAKVTVTGSFDDACGCHFGGLIVTDNTKDEVVFRKDIGDYDVILHVPEGKIRKTSLDLARLKKAENLSAAALGITANFPLKALTMNGRIIAEASDLDNSVAEDALEKGALAAGITGSGPATAIVVEAGKGGTFAGKMGIDNLIVTKVRRPKP